MHNNPNPNPNPNTLTDKDDKYLKAMALMRVRELPEEQVNDLRKEITARGLGTELLEAIDVQTGQLQTSQLQELVRLVRRQQCPDCGTHGTPLRGGIILKVISFIVMTTRRSHPHIACEQC